jgi:cold shock CspA family protein
MKDRETGIVKWFNAAQGRGLIRRSSGKDILVHFSVVDGPRGLRADDVIVVG